PNGTIWVDAQVIHGEAVIRVTDNGIGLKPDLVGNVFDLFTQADQSLDRSQGGLGIGLTVARNLVEMHGGRIEAKSDGPGKGSEFVIRIPVLYGPGLPELTRASTPVPVATGGGLRILVLEDNVDAAEILRLMLKLEGHEVRTAYEGTLGLETAA